MKYGNAASEMRPETANDLWSERNLRDQNDSGTAAPDRLLQSLDIHLRLPAARYPMQQKGVEPPGVDTCRNGVQRFGLRRMQRTIRKRLSLPRIDYPAAHFRLNNLEHTALHKTSER